MKIQFKHQAYQADAVEAGADCFAGLLLDEAQVLENIQKVQRRRNLPQSNALVATKSAAANRPILILDEPQKMEGPQTFTG